MTANTSATGGYLIPSSTLPDEDAALDALLQTFVVGCTGLPGAMVRPRWQPNPPPSPDVSVNWSAVGVIDIAPDGNVSITHESAGEGQDRLQHHETLDCQATFYGPAAGRYAALFRDGAMIAQNREALYLAGAALIDVGSLVSAPEQVNQQWIRRIDANFRLRRRVERVYSVLNVERAQGTITSDDLSSPEPFNVEP